MTLYVPVYKVHRKSYLVDTNYREETNSRPLSKGRVANEFTVVEGYSIGVLSAVVVAVVQGNTECSTCGMWVGDVVHVKGRVCFKKATKKTA